MSIPLVQNNEKDSINTSIIAIKRQIERINALLGLSNSEEIDTSVFATKDELQQAVTDLQPVDEVTADNMQSVTSNAVAESLSYSTTEQLTGGKWIDGKPIYQKVIIKNNFEFNTYINNVLENYDTVIHYDLTIIDASNDRLYSGNCTSQAETWITEIYFLSAQNKIYYGGGSSRGTLPKCIFIFEYTKTTD